MQDVIYHGVEQIAFVADYQQRAGVALQEVLQPQRRFEIQVVGGLVEQQHVGRGKEQGGQRDAHLPPA